MILKRAVILLVSSLCSLLLFRLAHLESLPGYTHFFGEVGQSRTLPYTFVIQNRTVVPIRITGVKPSCSCTVAKYSEDWIVPLGTSQVSIEMKSNSHPGPQSTHLGIELNNGSILRLNLHASVISEYPGHLPLGHVPLKETKCVNFEMKSASAPDLQIFGVEYDTERLKVNYTVNSNGIFYFTVCAIANHEGPQAAVVAVNTNDESASTKSINVSWLGIGDLISVPATVNFGIVEPSQMYSRTVRISSTSSTNFSIVNIIAPPTISYSLLAAARSASSRASHSISFELTAADILETQSGYLSVVYKLAGASEAQEKRIPFTVLATPRREID